MSKILPLHKIAVGNNNAGGLTLLTSVQDATGVLYTTVRSFPTRNRGERRFMLDGTVSFIGAERVQWTSSIMTVSQYDYILDTYEGLVTISHPTRAVSGGFYAFANYNAVLTMPDEEDLEYVSQINSVGTIAGFAGPGYKGVVWTFTKLEAL